MTSGHMNLSFPGGTDALINSVSVYTEAVLGANSAMNCRWLNSATFTLFLSTALIAACAPESKGVLFYVSALRGNDSIWRETAAVTAVAS